MIYNLKRRFVFVHIPRTSGTSMTKALCILFPDSFVGRYKLKHYRARGIKRELLPQWQRYFRFSVIRSPWDIIESDWRHTHYNPLVGASDRPPNIAPWWFDHVHEVAAMTFDQFVQRKYLDPKGLVDQGGFWQTYCCAHNGKDLGVTPFLFTELNQAWYAICHNLGVDDPPPYPHENADTGNPRGDWTPSLIDAVGEKCAGDIERFGFKPPVQQ